VGEFDTGHRRHADVGEEKVVVAIGFDEGFQRILAVLGRLHMVAFQTQGARHQKAHTLVILGYQNSCHVASLSPPAGSVGCGLGRRRLMRRGMAGFPETGVAFAAGMARV
jgi:hypothetical protein